MTHEESTKAIDWTLSTLGFGLFDDQKELWVVECSAYSKKQWFDAVKDLYRNRKNSFKPVLQDVTSRIKHVVVESDVFKEDDALSYEDNYKNFLKWRFEK